MSRPKIRFGRHRKPLSHAHSPYAVVVLGWNPTLCFPLPGGAALEAASPFDSGISAQRHNQVVDHTALYQRAFEKASAYFCSLHQNEIDVLAHGMKKASHSAVAERLIKIRVAFGYKQSQLARLFQITPARLNNWEGGKARPLPEEAYLYRVHFGITLDYIYLGDETGLPVKAAQKLGLFD